MAVIRFFKSLNPNQGFAADLRKYTKIMSIRVVLEYCNLLNDFPNGWIGVENFNVETPSGLIYAMNGNIHSNAPIREHFFRLQSERVDEVFVETNNSSISGFLNVYIEVEIADVMTFRR